MNLSPITLDHIDRIVLDPENAPFSNYAAFASCREGIKTLAYNVRDMERQYIASDPHAEHVLIHLFMHDVPPILPCAFDWFSITLVNYLRLVALVQLMNKNGWKSSALADPSNRTEIKKHCTEYVKSVVPEVYMWRNKVAAHFAATDPYNDNLGTLEQSIMGMVEFRYPNYYVGLGKWTSGTETSQLPQWALTKVYEDLRTRFWPEVQLPPSKP